MRPLLLTSMMASSFRVSNRGSAPASNQGHGNNENKTANPPATNSHARVTPTMKNPCGYSLFEMSLVLNYMNNQITYYYMTGAIPAAEQTRFHQLMKQ